MLIILKKGLYYIYIDYAFVKPYYIESEILVLELTEGQMDGYEVHIYDKAQMICDIAIR